MISADPWGSKKNPAGEIAVDGVCSENPPLGLRKRDRLTDRALGQYMA
jgi:hypothetical protein